MVKEYHVRIKILNEKGLDEANISIPYYRNEQSKEYIQKIDAINHNGHTKTVVPKEKIYDIDINERWSEKRFTFSDVKEHSIIEYKYKLISPFLFNLDGWTFQSDIPKISSEFKAKIPGNYVYNRSLYGSLKLTLEEAEVEKNCFYVPGYSQAAACEVITYVMKDIPAIEKDEQFMLAESNYISRIEFELSEMHRLDGSKKRFSKTWKDVDREFKSDRDIGRQLRKKDFFEKNVPSDIFMEKDPLLRAKKIYDFVKNHFTWNEKYGIYRDVRVKEAFQNKLGNIGEINISLINLLNAGGIDTDLMLLSTRDNGLPKKIYPVITDFNYVVAKTNINGKDYLLDATSKLNPFGMLPYRCLNLYGRVMDFDKESYWFDIEPEKTNRVRIMGTAAFDLEEGVIKGKLRETNQGYNAVSKYNKINSNSEEDYLNGIEEKSSLDFYIDDYTFQADKSNEKLTTEIFEFTTEGINKNDVIYFNPFLVRFFERNPFLKDVRYFPVDFGYPRKYEYNITYTIPDDYEVQSLPEEKIIALPNGTGSIKFSCAAQGKFVTSRYLLNINHSHFDSESYPYLKRFFEIAVNIEENSIIKMEKK
ncbi:hypothetical protein [Flagellimonas sp.]|uniref:hypothetical protein n=1 Tax=Flagellimonas sp. TaxID=2058762 RepID=UPI003B5A2FA1